LNITNSTPNFSVIDSQLMGIENSLWYELFERKFTFIPKSKAVYFEQNCLFGEIVSKNFPSARNEIKAAGNCFAADLFPATIFHLMRTVEYGLRALAKDLKVPITEDELEYKEWKIIIDQIYSKVRDLTESAQGSPKEKAELREFYNGVLSEFSGFKDVWRNNIMHTRKSYNELDANSVLTRVGDFMKRLATKVSESS
jgi:hypothetical protein